MMEPSSLGFTDETDSNEPGRVQGEGRHRTGGPWYAQ